MLKIVLAVTAAATIAGSSFAYAQPREGRPDGGRGQSVEDVRAFQAARLAALRAGLMLNADQEKHWPAFEQAMQDLQKLRLDRRQKMREERRQRRETRNGETRDFRQGRDRQGRDTPGRDTQDMRGRDTQDMREGRDQRSSRGNPAERMRERAIRMSENGAVLKRLADALDPLYSSLSDEQKRRFAILSRGGGQRGGWQGRGRGGEPGLQRGQRRNDGSSPENRRDRNPSTPDERGQRRGDLPEGAPLPGRAERMAFRNDVAELVAERTVGRVLGVKIIGAKVLDDALLIEAAAVFASKVIGGEPALFGGKAPPFGGQVTVGQDLGFSRKIEIGETPVFGRKSVQSI